MSGITRRRVSGMRCDVLGVSGVRLDLRDERPKRLRLLTLVVASLELILVNSCACRSDCVMAHLVLRGM